MSRKYLNDRWCVRCPKIDPSPYLAKNAKFLKGKTKELAVDVGCGNGRNSEFLKLKGFRKVKSVDMIPDYCCGEKAVLGTDPLPAEDKSVGVILCNYLMMFLNKKERKQLIREFKRVAAEDCIIILELYPALDSFAKTKEAMLEMQKDIFDSLGWKKIRYSQARFIAQNTSK